jgi:hypothetical protein
MHFNIGLLPKLSSYKQFHSCRVFPSHALHASKQFLFNIFFSNYCSLTTIFQGFTGHIDVMNLYIILVITQELVLILHFIDV